MPTDEIKLWAMDGVGGATPLSQAQQTDTERLLETTLLNNPDLLMPGLTLVGRQTRTETGPLDLLGIDQDGRLTLFELKRGQLNRDAISQIIDYGSWLESLNDGELAQYIAGNSGARGAQNIDDFPEWYAENRNAQDLTELRPVRLVLVGLGVDDTTTRMAQYLTARGVDLSLLTFHGYTHNGQTLLARQMPVESPAETDETARHRPRQRRLGRQARWERLNRHLQDAADQRPEVREIWDGALEMLRENFPGIQAVPNGGSSDWAQRRLALRRPGQRGVTAALQLSAEFHPGAVAVIYFPNAVGAALPEFVQLRQELPYKTWPPNNPRSQDGIIEIQFPFNSLAEWQTRKDQLAAVTHSVYQAFNAEYHPDEDTDDFEENP